MAEMAEPTKDVPFSLESSKKEDCLEYEELLNSKEAYLNLHIKNNNNFLPGRMRLLNHLIATWNNISDDKSVEKERQFEKVKQAQLVVQYLKDEETRLHKDLKETKLQKQIFLDSGKTNCPVDVKDRLSAWASSIPPFPKLFGKEESTVARSTKVLSVDEICISARRTKQD